MHLPSTNPTLRRLLSPDTVRLLMSALIRYDDPASILRSPKLVKQRNCLRHYHINFPQLQNALVPNLHTITRHYNFQITFDNVAITTTQFPSVQIMPTVLIGCRDCRCTGKFPCQELYHIATLTQQIERDRCCSLRPTGVTTL